MSELKTVKYELKDLVAIIILFVVVGLVLTLSQQIGTDVQNGYTQNTSSWNASRDLVAANTVTSNKLPTIAVVIVSAVIIGVLLRSFGQFA